MAVVGRFVQARWPVPEMWMLLFAGILTVLGVVFVLAFAAFRKTSTPGATIFYKICCWTGAGVWLGLMYGTDRWSWRQVAAQVGALAAAAMIAGFLAALASDDPPAPVTPEEAEAAKLAADLARQPEDVRERNAKAAEWERRLDRLCSLSGVKVPNIEPWEKGNGYTVEAITPEGGSTWKTIEAKVNDIGGDLDLDAGCRIGVQMGQSRRVALIDVMDVSTLHEEKPYPTDYGPLSIYDPLPGAVRDDDTEIGPDLRSKCMLLVGETGSGKTNAGHVIGVGVGRCTDALLWDLDFTAGLFLDLLEPFMRGQTKQPAVDWAAWDEQESLFMTRAAMRGHRARKAGYRELMREVDDDKIPVSEKLPAVIIRLDEIKRITGAPSEFPDIKQNVTDLINEGRAAAFRTVLLGLRATADIVDTGIQAQCGVIAVTRAKNDAEYAWAFGWHSGASVEDAPYPGCGFISLESGAKPLPEKWRRLRPKQLMEAGRSVDGRQPEMDELTRLALDGRNPDGSPMPDLMPDELDCYSTRWERYRAQFGGEHPSQPAAPTAQASTPTGGGGAMAAASGGSQQQALADLATTMADLDKAVQAAKEQRPDEDDLPPVDVRQTRADFAAILAAEGFGDDVDWGDPANWESVAETEPQPDDETKLLDLIREAGDKGARPRDLLAQLKDRHGIIISRDTLHSRLSALRDAGMVHNRQHGKWKLESD
jgi:hypothetical protein